MKLLLTTLALLCTVLMVTAQTKVTYYDKNYNEVPQSKARYVKSETTNDAGFTITKETNLKTGVEYRNDTTKGEEPYGTHKAQSWSSTKGKTTVFLDYNFLLVYNADTCDTKQYADKDIDSISYKAPGPVHPGGMQSVLTENIHYPKYAKEAGLQGRVLIKFIIDKKGEMRDISVVKGVHPSLDKEAVRVAKLFKFVSPPMLNGVPIEICYTLPVKFNLE